MFKKGLLVLLVLSLLSCFIPAFACPITPGSVDLVTGGIYSDYAIKKDKSVRFWGYEDSVSSVPYEKTGLSDITNISVGWEFALAVDFDGNAWAWGANLYGQLGNGTTGSGDYTPAQVSIPNDPFIVQVAAGLRFSLALDIDGNVWAWGCNDSYQLGENADDLIESTPIQVPGLSNIVSIAAGQYHCMVLDANGHVWIWGWSEHGQSGDGNLSATPTPRMVPNLNNVVKIDASKVGNFCAALTLSGNVWVWGDCSSPSLPIMYYPTQLSISKVKDIAAGCCHVLALKNGKVYAWGLNASGQLGISMNNYSYSSTPVLVNGLTNVDSIGVGTASSFAVSYGRVYSWGSNQYYNLGNNSFVNSDTPILLDNF